MEEAYLNQVRCREEICCAAVLGASSREALRRRSAGMGEAEVIPVACRCMTA